MSTWVVIIRYGGSSIEVDVEDEFDEFDEGEMVEEVLYHMTVEAKRLANAD